MTQKRVFPAICALLAFTALTASAAVTLDVKEHVLANGMKILMIPKPGVPRVVCHIYFKVGSINERPGITQKDIARSLGTSKQLVSYYIRNMREEGLVETHRSGRSVKVYPGTARPQ